MKRFTSFLILAVFYTVLSAQELTKEMVKLADDLYDAVKQIKDNPMEPTKPVDIEFGELGEEGVRWKPGQEDQYLNYRSKIKK